LISEDPKSAEIIKPFLRGRDVKRWRVQSEDQYLIKIESSENVPHPWGGKQDVEAEKIFSKRYPAIHAHFQTYRQAMIDRYDQGKYFWELRACVYWKEFERPKIVYSDIYLHQSFAWDIKGHYTANTLACRTVKSESAMIPTPEKLSQVWIFYPPIPHFQQESDIRRARLMDLKMDLKVRAAGGFQSRPVERKKRKPQFFKPLWTLPDVLGLEMRFG
jgi:hypothetical protein